MKTQNCLLLSLLALSLAACDSISGFGGTDVGNPDTKITSALGPELSREACDTLNFCYSGFDRAGCKRAGLEVAGIPFQMGLPTSETLLDLDEALSAERAEVQAGHYRACLDHLRTLRCSDLPMNQIWNPSSPSNYKGLLKFWVSVKDVCGKIVKPKP
jgi:predicted small secreted protein